MNDGGLAGCGVLITRPEHQSHDLVSEIEAAGGKVFRFPTIDIIGRNIDEVGMDFAKLVKPDIVVFVSGNAVAYGLAAVKRKDAKIAAIGPQPALQSKPWGSASIFFRRPDSTASIFCSTTRFSHSTART